MPTRQPEIDEPAREELALRRQRSLEDLLETRADLVGVHPFADLLHDSVRWSA
jgi:hypothetical protein